MKFCWNCGKEIKDDAKFCPFCGQVQKLAPAEEGAPTAAEPETQDAEEIVTPVVPEEVPVEKFTEPSENFSQAEATVSEAGEEVDVKVEVKPEHQPTPTPVPTYQAYNQNAQPGQNQGQANGGQATYQQPQQQAQYQQQPGQGQPNQQQYQNYQPGQGQPGQQQYQNYQQNQGHPGQQQYQQAPQSNPQFDAAMAQGKNYFSWLNKNVAHPDMSLTNHDHNGLINMILISIFSAAGISHLLSNSMSSGASGAMSSMGLGELSSFVGGATSDAIGPFPSFLGLLFWVAITLLLLTVTTLVFSNKVVHNQITFLGAFNKLFAPASLAVYVSAACLLFTFVFKTGMFLVFLTAIPLMLVNLAFAGAIWDTSAKVVPSRRFY